MARMRKDYETSWWPRLRRWIDAGASPLDDALEKALDETREGHQVLSQEAAAEREERAER